MASDSAILQTAEAFAADLAQPLSPRLCPFCFALFMHAVEPNGTKAMLMLTQCHVFYDALMAFICSEWTEERRAAVCSIRKRSAIRCNKCKPQGQASCDLPCFQDAIDAPGSVDPFALVYVTACWCIHGGVANHIDSGKGFGSKRGRWPISAQQLFPYGAEQSMQSLVAQLGTFSLAECLITDLVALHRPLAFAALLLPGTREMLVGHIIARLSACTAAVNADLAKLRQPIVPAVRDAIVKRHLDACYRTAVMLYVVALGPDHHYTEESFLYAGRELDLFAALDGVCLLTHAHPSDQMDWLEILTTHLYYLIPGSQRAAAGYPDRAPPYARGIQRLEQVHASPYRALFFYLPGGLHAPARACNGPGCGKTVHDKGTPGAFARCGTCRAVQYCSRACQRADWTRASFPHKELCGMLRTLLEFVGDFEASLSADEFVARCTAHAFPLEYVDRLILWATNGEVVPRFAVGLSVQYSVPGRI